jgi:hypothetical protein
MSDQKREMAIGRFQMLKKKIYELGVKSQAFVEEIQNEVNAFAVSEIKTLAEELVKLQKDYSIMAKEMLQIKSTYNIEEE